MSLAIRRLGLKFIGLDRSRAGRGWLPVISSWFGACALLGSSSVVLADIPAAPVMTLYQFNGALRIPYYQIGASGPGAVAGYLTQGSSVIPCLVVRNGKALTDASGTPYVGFKIVVDSAKAGPDATAKFEQALARQASLRVENHHCGADVRHVMNVRKLYALTKAPFFDPPRSGARASASQTKSNGESDLEALVREFHNSQECAGVNNSLLGRRERLARAWDDFIAHKSSSADKQALTRAKHLDYSMRTAIYEGHLDRGCNAYGACERDVVVLSIRNRAIGQCLKGQGCRFPGDFQGVASDPSQYNIWDAFLTQISGLTACYLRDDLANRDYYQRIQSMHHQTVGDAERILYGGDQQLTQVFPDTPAGDLTELRHYYHPPAMQKCFPQKDRIEYMSGAVAENNGQFALIANTRIEVGKRVGGGYTFKEFRFDHTPDGDQLHILDNYPGFIVDARKVSLKSGHSCTAYGVSPSCSFSNIKRYRTIPSWLSAGKPLALNCRIQDRGESCKAPPSDKRVRVGGACDTEMMPVTRVP
ncbi:hypothetical protein [Thiorhodovibrio frisius]|uniref:Uncharacterized protein n=1 Tax=Thiorhodovibrio frisius TaxID=631362 RepID=H8Z1G3_9GAMM|nr:hypothetical protein [Thiorhodovibrio frisius]EIC22512.1 hypothetical protein Thi970DRAFT_02779 [Thiorhodovibrio frisius]WPL24812.1 hypothetical protein Thiofri_05036 [Thiorhodovibrio frisius]